MRRFLHSVGRVFTRRYELLRVRMSLRKMNDFEMIGRMMGLLLFPAAYFGCGGYFATYSNNRIWAAVDAQGNHVGYKRPPQSPP